MRVADGPRDCGLARLFSLFTKRMPWCAEAAGLVQAASGGKDAV